MSNYNSRTGGGESNSMVCMDSPDPFDWIDERQTNINNDCEGRRDKTPCNASKSTWPQKEESEQKGKAKLQRKRKKYKVDVKQDSDSDSDWIDESGTNMNNDRKGRTKTTPSNTSKRCGPKPRKNMYSYSRFGFDVENKLPENFQPCKFDVIYDCQRMANTHGTF